VGSLIAAIFAKAGLKVVALEPGPFRTQHDYLPDELGATYFGVVRIQPDTLSYNNNFVELDPHYRDQSGVGLPVLRITYDLRENENRLADWMEGKSEEILRGMGATKTWRGDRFSGVGSSHDFGGARMGIDPGKSVVDPEMEVHDTPGLYVYSGAAFPTCPGINPTLSLLALVYRAAERLVKRLANGG
jgi:gluconate 2-dehydrogenase alpha chain